MIRVVFTFLATFFATISGSYFLSLVIDFICLWAQRSIMAALALASVCCWTWFFLYSKTSLQSKQVLLRYLFAYVANLIIAFTILELLHTHLDWYRGTIIVYHLTTFSMTTVTFVCIVALSTWQAKIACESLNQNLEQWQRYRAKELTEESPSQKRC